MELMLVIAITGFVIIMAPSILAGLNRKGVRHAAEHLYSELQLARLSAIRSKKPCALVFNTPSPNQYFNSLTKKHVDLGQYRGGVRFLPTGPDGKSMAHEIRFNRQGMSMSLAPVHAYLTNKDGSPIYRLRVMLPGGLSMERWNGETWRTHG